MKEHTEEVAGNESLSPPTKRKHTRQRKSQLSITETVIAGSLRYRVIGCYIAGKRVRKSFATKKEAQTFIETQAVRESNIGNLAKNMTPQLANDAAEVQAMIAPFNTRLLDAMRQWTEARSLLASFPDVSLAECVKHYAQVLTERATSWTVEKATAEWLASIEKKSARYQDDASARLKRFRESLGNMSMADVSPEHIQNWLNGLGQIGARTTKNYLAIASIMFAYAVRKKKAPRNPVLEVDRPEVIQGETGILTPSQLTNLLKHLPDDAKPFVLLSAFAGLRPSEVQRLAWEDINFESKTIVVGARKSKTKRRRVVPMTANLAAWLKPLAKDEGIVIELCDLTVREKRLRPARKAAGITRWPHDCLRHSAATYWLQTEQDSARVALWLGHDQSVLHEHYKGLLANPKDAEEWFNIMPPKEDGASKIVAFKVA